jgi:hypothetical protein
MQLPESVNRIRAGRCLAALTVGRLRFVSRTQYSTRYFLMVVACACGIMFLRSTIEYPTGVFDLHPLYYGAKAWQATGNAYYLEPVVPASHHNQPVYRIGNSYPLPAVLIVSPLSLLEPQQAAIVWLGFLTVALLLALRLSGTPSWFVLFFPILNGLNLEQYTILILIFQILALWAWRERRPWLLALCCTLILTKPTQGLLFVLVLAFLARNWRAQLIVTGSFWFSSVILDPNWLSEWLPTLAQYREVAQHPTYWGLAFFAIPLLLMRDYIGGALMLQFLITPYPVPACYITSAVPLSSLNARLSWLLVPPSFLLPLVAPSIGFGWATALTIFLPITLLAVSQRWSPTSAWRSPQRHGRTESSRP